MYYFDSAGSFPVLEQVKKSLATAIQDTVANPSASHELGLQANALVDKTREQIAEMIGAMPSEIIFTSGATESNNLALKGFVEILKSKDKKHIITSSIEHKCILSICNFLSNAGFEITYMSPTNDGIILPEAIEQAIRPDTGLVSIMHVNNELGSINSINEIGQICFDNDVYFHTDAAQSFGKLNINVDEMNIDLMSISAHKIGGLKGIGALYIRDARDLAIIPVIHGAGQESGIRGGTVAAPLVLSFGEACRYFPVKYQAMQFEALRKHLISQLEQAKIKFQINGKEGLPHIMSLTLPDIDVITFVSECAEKFALAQGSACSSKEIEASHVLKSIGLTRKLAGRTIRLSFDFETTSRALDILVANIRNMDASCNTVINI